MARIIRRKKTIFLDDSIREYLFTGETPPHNTPGFSLYADNRFFDWTHTATEKAWREHREQLLREWKEQGKEGLPWAARVYDA